MAASKESTPEEQLATIRAQQRELSQQEARILRSAQTKAVKAIVREMITFDITIDMVAAALKSVRTGRTARTAKAKTVKRRKFVPKPKYANPKDPSQTWSGMGKAPEWARKLKAARRLNSALIEQEKK